MNRSKTDKNRGFYRAVCCCVLIIAIIGYVSRFAGNSKPQTPNHTDSSYTEVADKLGELPKAPVVHEKSTPEPTTVPVEKKAAPAAKNVIAEDNTPSFSKPIDGRITGKYSGDTLVFCETLSDWRSHNGVDIKANIGDTVLASADGVVESVFSDKMGCCVLIDHENGFKTLYANLEEQDSALTGQNVKKGDKIGTVGDSALADISKGAHLHFEILKDDNPQDPSEYLK